MSDLEDALVWQLATASVATPVRELTFHPPRRWRFDLSWPDAMVACEVEGATWSGGRHTRGSGFEKDCEKYNQASVDGWLVVRVTGNMVNDGRAIEWITRALALTG